MSTSAEFAGLLATPTASALRGWQSTTAPYRTSSTARATLQLCTTLLPLSALVALM
jgi:hypothetical protein